MAEPGKQFVNDLVGETTGSPIMTNNIVVK
jgi:hypothetical protein